MTENPPPAEEGHRRLTGARTSRFTPLNTATGPHHIPCRVTPHPGTRNAKNADVNEATTKYRTKLEMLQTLARRRTDRSRLLSKARVEAPVSLRGKANTKLIPSPV